MTKESWNRWDLLKVSAEHKHLIQAPQSLWRDTACGSLVWFLAG